MVGVPRSKGCRICVQRRVKCDQTRPFCVNCKKGNRPCPGYGQDMKFQDEGPRLRQRFERSFGTAGQSSSNDPSEISHDTSSPASNSSGDTVDPDWGFQGLDTESRPVAFGWLEAAEYANDALDLRRTPTDLGLTLANCPDPDEDRASLYRISQILFSPAMEQNQLLSSFAFSIAPGDQSGFPKAFKHNQRWLSHLPEISGKDPLLDTSVRAVTLAHLGRLHNNEVFLNESRPYYGKALRLLNASLLDDIKGLSSETLSATILLSFYEMFSSEENDSWVRHAGGAGTLMRIRGPSRHRYGFDREIYLAFRHALIIEAFERDRPCFLDEPEWRELANQVHDDVRSSGAVGDRVQVFDSANDFFLEMVQVPNLLYHARRLEDRTNLLGSKEAAKDDISQRATSHRSQLKSIFENFSSGLRNLGHAPTSYISGDPVIPIYYKFGNIFIATLHTGYWSIMILLNLILRDLDPGTAKADLYAIQNREAALDCCRSEPFTESSSFIGPFFAIFALRLTLMVLEPEHEREWVVRKLLHIGNTSMSMAKNLPPDVQRPIPRIRASIKALDRKGKGNEKKCEESANE